MEVLRRDQKLLEAFDANCGQIKQFANDSKKATDPKSEKSKFQNLHIFYLLNVEIQSQIEKKINQNNKIIKGLGETVEKFTIQLKQPENFVITYFVKN